MWYVCDVCLLFYYYIYWTSSLLIKFFIKGFNVNTWNRAKVGLMKDMLHCKFEQHPNLAKKLCETGNLHLGEAIEKDTFYGTGFSLMHKEATNQTKWKINKLGELLMAQRTVQQAILNGV